MSPEQKRRYKILGERIFEREQQNEYDKKLSNEEFNQIIKLENYHRLQEQRRITQLEIASKKLSKQRITQKKNITEVCAKEAEETLKEKEQKILELRRRESKINSEREMQKRYLSEQRKRESTQVISKRILLSQSEKILINRRKELNDIMLTRVKKIRDEATRQFQRNLELKKLQEDKIKHKMEKTAQKLLKQEAYTQSVMKIKGRPDIPTTLILDKGIAPN